MSRSPNPLGTTTANGQQPKLSQNARFEESPQNKSAGLHGVSHNPIAPNESSALRTVLTS